MESPNNPERISNKDPHNVSKQNSPKILGGSDSVGKPSHNSSPQQLNTYLALKKLKQTEQNIRKLKGRFKVLRIKQQSFRAKTVYHENLIKLTEDAQRFQSRHKEDILKACLNKETNIQKQKEINSKIREEIKEKNKQARQNMLIAKIEENKKLKEESIQNDKRFRQIKREEQMLKAQKRKRIFEEEKEKKIKLDRYKQSRAMQIKEYKTLDANSIIEINITKQKQLEKLIKIEQDLSIEHNNSAQASRVLKTKLREVIEKRSYKKSNIQSLNTSMEEKRLPTIKKNSKSSNTQIIFVT